jgi:hypothetical protein
LPLGRFSVGERAAAGSWAFRAAATKESGVCLFLGNRLRKVSDVEFD